MKCIYLITPTYNADVYLDETISSVVNQNCEGTICYHIQDACSKDMTLSILQKWKNKLNTSQRVRFSYASEPDTGMYDAINKGFAAFTIPSDAFMAWINADDVLFPGAIQAVFQADATFESSVDWVYGLPSQTDAASNHVIWPKSIYYPQSFIRAGLADGILWPFFQQEGCFFRKKLWDRVNGCDTKFRMAGDWDLWRRMAVIAPPVHIPKALGSFRVHTGQLSSDIVGYSQEIDTVISQKTRKRAMRILTTFKQPTAFQISQKGLSSCSINVKERTRAFLLGCGLTRLVCIFQSLSRTIKNRFSSISPWP